MCEERKTFCYIDKDKDEIRKAYKYYKKRKPKPDYSDVIDFDNPTKYKHLIKKLELNNIKNNANEQFCSVGLKHPKTWQVYELLTCPGFIVIPNPFLSYGAQSYWIKKTLTDYTKEPYPCNLDILMELDKSSSMWEISQKKSSDNLFINQLRWVHMGYHFDYNVVDYKAKKYHGFPHDLSELTKTIASIFNFPDYVAETGIINYYPEGSSMGGHTDHYEEDLRQPLISYSLGQSAIYLIGGDTRDIKPEAIWVRSGDVMLMTGPSRTAFHAVPRILTEPTETTPTDIGACPLVHNKNIQCRDDDNNGVCSCAEKHEQLWTNEMIQPDWNGFSDYLSNTRINVNIRQVHKYNSNS